MGHFKVCANKTASQLPSLRFQTKHKHEKWEPVPIFHAKWSNNHHFYYATEQSLLMFNL